MRGEHIHSPPIQAGKIDGITDSATEENFQPGLYGQFARLAYPVKTDATLASIGRTSDRAARAWMAGDAAAPALVSLACLATILRRSFRR
jgi:hypothetical protein